MWSPLTSRDGPGALKPCEKGVAGRRPDVTRHSNHGRVRLSHVMGSRIGGIAVAGTREFVPLVRLRPRSGGSACTRGGRFGGASVKQRGDPRRWAMRQAVQGRAEAQRRGLLEAPSRVGKGDELLTPESRGRSAARRAGSALGDTDHQNASEGSHVRADAVPE